MMSNASLKGWSGEKSAIDLGWIEFGALEKAVINILVDGRPINASALRLSFFESLSLIRLLPFWIVVYLKWHHFLYSISRIWSSI